MRSIGSSTLELSPRELVSLYLHLRRGEEGLDPSATEVFERVRSLLYDSLSIEEMEHLEDYYALLVAAERPRRA